MKIEKIHLHNFRQFSGDTIVEFSTDSQKNITVIHAMNGSGKTTFLQSFYWALYGKVDLPNSSRLLNENTFAEMTENEKKDVFIEIYATHEGAVYNIKRSVSVTKNTNGDMKNSRNILEVSYTDKEGKSKLIDDEIKAQNKINSIIPEKLARYFFFDGERIQALGENTAKARKDISNGIKSILNINLYDSLKTTLDKKVIDSFQKEIKGDHNSKLDSLIDKKAEIDIKVDNCLNVKNDYENQIDLLTTRISELNSLIKENETAVEYQKKLDSNTQEIKKLEIEIEALLYGAKGSGKESFPKLYTKYANFKLMNALKDFIEINLDVANVNENSIIGINVEAVDQIIDKKICLCGREIGKDEEKQLENLKQFLPPHDQRVLIYGYKEKYLERLASFSEIEDLKELALEKYFDLKEKVAQMMIENKEINKTLSSNSEVADFNDERNEKEKEKSNLLKEIGKVDYELENLNKERDQLDKEIEKCAKVDEYNNKVLRRLNFTREIVNILEYNIEKKKTDIHMKLTKEVNNIFSCVAHKNTKEVIIENDYSYKIRDKVTKHEALSEGEAVITSLSFIASIIKIAKELEEQKKAECGEGVEYPLVLDAPFAKLDSVHINGIAPVLPRFSDQLILFTVDQQFRSLSEVNVTKSIGIEYIMKNNMDKEVIIERLGE